ncbi:MAG: 50S ribosomal protein L21 [Planctomycetota bacterium]
MYAVVDNKGQQYRVELGEEVLMDRMNVQEGEKLEFNRVLLVSGEDVEPRVGQPTVDNAHVSGEVVAHEKGPKLTSVRYKGPSQTKMGHRQDYTRVRITDIQTE